MSTIVTYQCPNTSKVQRTKMPYQNAVTPFCHVFNAEDEEDFLEAETIRFRDKIHCLLEQLKFQDACLRSIDLDFGVGKEEISWLSEAIRGNQHLQRLRISNWPIGDYGAQCMAEILAGVNAPCQLKELSMRACGIQSAGTKATFTAMESNRTVVKLDLSRNNVRYGFENLAQAFQQNIPWVTTLQELDLSLVCLDEACALSLLSLF